MANSTLVLQILEKLGEGDGLSLAELTSALDAPKSSVYRALQELETEAWIVSDARRGGRWALTTKILRLAEGVQRLPIVKQLAAPWLDTLWEQTQENVHLAILEGRDLVLVERRESPHVLRVFYPLGERMAWYATSVGKAIASTLAPEEIEGLLSGGIKPITARTVADRESLLAQLGTIRDLGYAVNDREWSDGVTSVGAALTGTPLRVGISISGPSTRIDSKRIAEYSTLIRGTAKAISAELAGA